MEKNFVKGVFNQTKRFSAIFFDLDNTLIQTRKADAKTCDKVIRLLLDVHFHTIIRTISCTFMCEICLKNSKLCWQLYFIFLVESWSCIL